MTRLLLASASPARRATLEAAGVDALVAVSGVDEDAVLADGRRRYGNLPPADAVLVLAQAKAEAVSRALTAGKVVPDGAAPEDDLDDLLVLGCDSMLELDGDILGKPADADDAARMLALLSGRSHRVLSAVAVAARGRTRLALSVSRVRFAELTPARIERYVASGEPFGKAGAYAIQSGAAAWIERVEGSYSGIMGLPLYETARLLRQAGVAFEGTPRAGTVA